MTKSRHLTSQDLSWFLDLHSNHQLDLDPPYQRKSIWGMKERRYFLDTIFRGYPSPSIFLHKIAGDEAQSKYAVVDGKQRLETVIRFVEDKITIAKDFGDTRLDGKLWSDIKADPELRATLSDYRVPVEMISVDPAVDYVNQVFDRINRYSRKLSRQELRHARYDGWFISFIDSELGEAAWTTFRVVTTAKGKRMADAQFLSELLLVILKGKVSGFDQDELDEFYANFDEPSESEIESVRFDEETVVHTFKASREILVGMEKSNKSVTKHARTLKDLYTLWAVVALDFNAVRRKVVSTSNRYDIFMEKVEILTLGRSSSRNVKNRDIRLYADNNVGASTEAPQRENRYAALKRALLGK